MKLSWAGMIVSGIVLAGSLAVLSPAGYSPPPGIAGAYGDPYAGYGGVQSNDGTGPAQQGVDETAIDEDMPSMLLEKEPFFADPNIVKAAIRSYPELEKVLTELAMRSRAEVRQWLSYREDQDPRLSEVRAMHTQSVTELQVLKKVAEADGAKRTAAAIDALLLERQGRYERLAREVVLQQRKLLAERNQAGDAAGRAATRRTNTTGGRTGGRTTYPSGRR